MDLDIGFVGLAAWFRAKPTTLQAPTVASTAQALPKLFGNLSLGGTKLFSIEIFMGERVILLMVQKSGDHQLRLVVYPIIYSVFIHPRWLGMGFLNHQQYEFSTRALLKRSMFYFFPGRCDLHGQCDCFGAKSVEYLSINDEGISYWTWGISNIAMLALGSFIFFWT